jgi:hypothetical protein
MSDLNWRIVGLTKVQWLVHMGTGELGKPAGSSLQHVNPANDSC